MPDAPRIKICGITRLEDAERAVELGAWAIGLIFHRPSPRDCKADDAAAIAAALRRDVEIVGVFVNPALDALVRSADRAGLTMLQLHGDEGPAFCSEAARRTGCRVIKAARVRTGADVQRLASFHTDYVLADAHVSGVRGGTGETFDWELVRHRPTEPPLILSGGLTAENVSAGIAATRPYAVDVASGVEAVPGRKDPDRLAAFFDAVRSPSPAGTEAA